MFDTLYRLHTNLHLYQHTRNFMGNSMSMLVLFGGVFFPDPWNDQYTFRNLETHHTCQPDNITHTTNLPKPPSTPFCDSHEPYLATQALIQYC